MKIYTFSLIFLMFFQVHTSHRKPNVPIHTSYSHAVGPGSGFSLDSPTRSPMAPKQKEAETKSRKNTDFDQLHEMQRLKRQWELNKKNRVIPKPLKGYHSAPACLESPTPPTLEKSPSLQLFDLVTSQ